MTSLVQIKAKLETILERTSALEYVGKAIDALDADMRYKLDAIPALVFAEFQKRVLPSDARPAKPKRKRTK
jgi:hypothetical protein